MKIIQGSKRDAGILRAVYYRNPMNQGLLIIGVLSLVFAYFTVRDYLREGRKLSPSARVWRGIAIIFATIAFLLFVLV